MKRALLTFFFVSFFSSLVCFVEAAQNDLSLIDLNRTFLEERRNPIEWGRDPFILPVRPTGTTPVNHVENEEGKSYSLSAVIYREGEGAAIINHRIVRKGDRVEGMIVEEIFPDRVFLKSGAKVMELKVENFLSK